MLQNNQENSPIKNTDNSNKRKPFDVISSIFRRKSKDLDCDIDSSNGNYGCKDHNISYENDSSTTTLPINRSQPISTPTTGYSDTNEKPSPVHGSVYSNRSPVSPRVRSLEEDMEALRLSRQDNPYIQQKLESYSLRGDSQRSISPPSLYSSSQILDQQKLVPEDEEDIIIKDENDQNLHEHLIRSPPPQFPKKLSQFVFHSRTNSPMHQNHHYSADCLQSNDNQISDLANNSSRTCLKTKGSFSLITVSDYGQAKDIKRNKDLKPLTKKMGTGALDPSMRQVLEFQKQIYFQDQGIDISSPVEINKRAPELSPQRSHSFASKSRSTSTVARSVSLPAATVTSESYCITEIDNKGSILAPVKGGRINFGGTGQSYLGMSYPSSNESSMPNSHRHRLSSFSGSPQQNALSSLSTQDFG